MPRNLLIPVILGVILIFSLSFAEGFYIKDRWGEPGAEAEEMGERFALVPKEIGRWQGEDLPVEEIVRRTAGAVNYVSRRYTNSNDGSVVTLWLIVGHSRDVVRHTPNVCYPNSGFRQMGNQIRQYLEMANGKDASFFTAKFQKEDALSRHVERVFWAWNTPDSDKWEAPSDARHHYGLQRAMYKVYFTSTVQSDEDIIEQNAAYEFGRKMLPAIDAALFPETNAPLEVQDSYRETEFDAYDIESSESDVDTTELELEGVDEGVNLDVTGEFD